jgi:tripartite-type tricarboxylate transporter receptor subunit TctC
MRFPRRKFLRLAAGAAALPLISRDAIAQTYPTRPVRLIVPTAAGSGNDLVARIMAEWLAERLGQQFVIENRAGAGSNIGTEAAVRAPPDGHTLLLVATPNAINATLYSNLNFNFIRDIAPAAGIIRYPNVMEVHPSVPVKTVPEFLAYAKARPGKINMASAGNGSSSHIAGELFKMMTGIDMVHVPYRGAAPAITDLLGGQVDIYFGTLSGSAEYVRSGRLRALAVTTSTRSDVLPDVPTIDEYIPGYEASSWCGLGAPRNTPTVVLEKLNEVVNEGLKDPRLKARLADLGGSELPGPPQDFGKLVSDETDKWAKIVKFANLKPE